MYDILTSSIPTLSFPTTDNEDSLYQPFSMLYDTQASLSPPTTLPESATSWLIGWTIVQDLY